MSAPAAIRLAPSKYDWPKLDFEEMLLDKHYSSRSKKNVKYIAIHHMTIVGDGKGSALVACYRTWQSRAASAHYGVDGSYVAQYVWDKDYAWATGSTAGNEYGISIEHANSSTSGWKVGDTTWKTGAKLVAQLHKTYKLGRPVKDKTVRKHSSFIATGCPGPYLGSQIWDAYVKECQHQYDLLEKVPTTPKPSQNRKLEILSNNIWGYGDLQSGATQAKRLPLVLEMIEEFKPHLFPIQEASDTASDRIKHKGDNKERTPLEYMDFHLGDLGYTRDKFGSDGRYIYRDKSEVNLVKGKTVLMTPEWGGDDKQAAVGVYERDRLFSLSSFHTENEDKSGKTQAGQIRSLTKQTFEFAKPLGVDTRWQFHAGDANNNVLALRAFSERKFVDSAMRAPASKRTNEEYRSVDVYLKTPLGERIDFITVYQDVVVTEFEQIIDYPTSDHNPQRAIIQL